MSNHDPHIQELITLKTIAETLNESNELAPMLDVVIAKLLELTGLTTGWLFLVEDRGTHEFVASRNLPPALNRDDNEPMRCGSCWCLERYDDGRLKNAVNILNCKRLDNAVRYQWGDTEGITHHATVPLRSGSRRFGVLNVAAPGKLHFTKEELALLESVAYQIGSAIERMRLYAAEQRRADLFARLGEYSSALGAYASQAVNRAELTKQVMSLMGRYFDWPVAVLLEPIGNEMTLRALYSGGQTTLPHAQFPLPETARIRSGKGKVSADPVSAENAQRLADLLVEQGWISSITRAVAVPLAAAGDTFFGLLLIGYDHYGDAYRADMEVIEALAEHIGITLQRIRLEENRRELARMDERNRLARDLHDSVSQTLFSLVMMSKGVGGMLAVEPHEQKSMLQDTIHDIQFLSQSALKEMRELIMQLRPPGLEEGLMTGLKQYGERLKLHVSSHISGIQDLPRIVEEALWRIGQEALNNVSKHADTKEVTVVLTLQENDVELRIEDHGRGITKQRLNELTRDSIGLSSMRERAESLGGQFRLYSVYREGTIIEVLLPLRVRSTEKGGITDDPIVDR
ncbi:GAF domain-containing sensor histidine kinase [Paenibacillus sp. ISL-20]|uniref:GAF domain-containing sensor histidine kinase n=1 Tax=Paenibacillus sp. ISL-20 TaxID=2819163 RepID=UPI001BE6D0E1|nr:GAF domain-containing sensor histidine kinase [Paenibacillus sp. ISL-20]MBT2759809.1 GAF domain-containing sensor histidine kinase [Paenibacillus sp. ISL-20]